jgi:hypothetical protein
VARVEESHVMVDANWSMFQFQYILTPESRSVWQARKMKVILLMAVALPKRVPANAVTRIENHKGQHCRG